MWGAWQGIVVKNIKTYVRMSQTFEKIYAVYWTMSYKLIFPKVSFS